MTRAIPSMTSYQPGDIVLIFFPYSSGAMGPRRPGLVILDSGDDDIVVSRMTTKPYATAWDVSLVDWAGAGLNAPSVVRLHKIATLETKDVARKLGSLQPPDRVAVSKIMQQTYGIW